MVVAAIFVAVSAGAFILTSLASMLVIGGWLSGHGAAGVRDLWWGIWFPAATILSTYNTIESMRYIGRQEVHRLAVVVGSSILALITFPGFYISIYGG